MKIIKNLKWQLTLVIVLFVVIGISFTAVLSFMTANEMITSIEQKVNTEGEVISKQFEDSLVSNSLNESKNQIDVVANVVREYFKEAELATKITANDPNAKAMLTENYEESIPWLKSSLESIHGQSKTVMFLYTGYTDGSIYTATGWETEDYDPRVRPWYKLAMDNPGELQWTNPYIDFATGDLIITAAQTIEDNSGTVIGVTGADVILSDLQELLTGYKMGENGYIFAVDNEGTVLNHPEDAGKTDPETFDKIGKPLATDVLRDYATSGKDQSEIIRYEYNGDPKTAIVARVPDLEFALVGAFKTENLKAIAAESKQAFVDLESNISQTALESQNTTRNRLLIISAFLIAILAVISILYARVLSKPIIRMSEEIRILAAGKFSHPIKIKASTNELEEATDNLEHLRVELSDVIKDVKSLSSEINAASEELSVNGDNLADISDGVTSAVNEIANGATEQAMDSEKSSQSMVELSDEINELARYNEDQVDETNKLAKNSERGVKAIENLNSKTSESTNIIKETSVRTNELSQVIGSITGITDTIAAIAEQTNLLALNASIEAARAGEAGRGFAVVADEIRKLAEETSESTNKINGMISQIRETSEEVVLSMSSVENITMEQVEASNEVANAFDDIKTSLDVIVNMIDESTSKIHIIEEQKNNATANIQNIVAVTEETAASSEEVNASMDVQHESVETISNLASELNRKITQLNKDLEKFDV